VRDPLNHEARGRPRGCPLPPQHYRQQHYQHYWVEHVPLPAHGRPVLLDPAWGERLRHDHFIPCDGRGAALVTTSRRLPLSPPRSRVEVRSASALPPVSSTGSADRNPQPAARRNRPMFCQRQRARSRSPKRRRGSLCRGVGCARRVSQGELRGGLESSVRRTLTLSPEPAGQLRLITD
jgi:hypothetical protein